jgi:hypothetical protein
MVRAYGGRALFKRFKWRAFAPFFCYSVHSLLLVDLKGILLVVFFWGVWHGLMQTYGFCPHLRRENRNIRRAELDGSISPCA